MKKELNQRKIIVLIFIIALIALFIIFKIIEKNEDRRAITLINNLNIEFNSNTEISDLIESLEGELTNNSLIDTTSLGTKDITIEYKNKRNKKKKKEIEINIVDTTKPKIYMDDTITIKQGNDINLTETVLSGDDCDSNPTRRIIGEYDINKEGKYDLVFEVEDKSGNIEKKNFTLNVVKYSSNDSKEEVSEKHNFSEILKKYKNENTKIGIDVSLWQGDIDWKKVKESGCEFAYIRVGYQNGFDGELKEDSKFEQNINQALGEGLDVGVYFYSYAKNAEESKEQAQWVTEKISKYDIKLPIAFDWESWSSFIKCQFSFYDINNIAKSYMDVLKKNGYQTSLYSSRKYLQKVWYDNKYDNIWLAHYTEKTDYKGNYQYWQLSNNGRINGVDGAVDINVYYK